MTHFQSIENNHSSASHSLSIEKGVMVTMGAILTLGIYAAVGVLVAGSAFAGTALVLTSFMIKGEGDNRALQSLAALYLLSMTGIIYGLMDTGLAGEWSDAIWEGMFGPSKNENTSLDTTMALNMASTIAVPAAGAVTGLVGGLVGFAYSKCFGMDNSQEPTTSNRRMSYSE